MTAPAPVPVVRLRNWERDQIHRLHGEAHGHPRFADGERVTTTPVARQFRVRGALMAQTRNTLYELTRPDGEAWFAPREAADERPAAERPAHRPEDAR